MLAVCLLAALVLVVVVALDRQNGAHSRTVALLLDKAETDRQTHAAQIASLLQRIQAPQAAVIEHATRGHEGPRDLDPLSDQETVEQQDIEMARLAVEAIEAREAELAKMP